jgi:hypothetical protein
MQDGTKPCVTPKRTFAIANVRAWVIALRLQRIAALPNWEASAKILIEPLWKQPNVLALRFADEAP